MKVTREMKIKEVLAMNEEKVLSTLTMLAPEFERLNYPKLRRAMSGRVSIEQAAKIARVPLTEMLYVLNLALGEDEAELAAELFLSDWRDFEYTDVNLPVKPSEIVNIKDTDENVIFVDLMPQAEEKRDPMPEIAKGLVSLKNPTTDVLLIKHPFDPIPLREMFARRQGLASWAEERKTGEWFVYFYRPFETATVAAHPPVRNKVFLKAMATAV
ncbi:MAG: DUF2249 domain-containing protein [Acidobacteriota bacterium]|nr:DUF2249 domain-containing protein [Acidobacteriota bacterium]